MNLRGKHPSPNVVCIYRQPRIFVLKLLARYTWAETAIAALSAKVIVKGISADRFDPAGSITRADIVLLLVRALKLKVDTPSEQAFSDVLVSAYYVEAVAIAKQLRLRTMQGDHPTGLDGADRQSVERVRLATGRSGIPGSECIARCVRYRLHRR
ncbi:S-layer homology domain-containing protein [Cohnella boryungensis]|uniref:S-layer homology domain-containing protein n=1 Tax=Cohnella boryungensis TaxID=768479 RepID=A0ABV8SGY4_9BACL